MRHPNDELTALLDGALAPGRAEEVLRHLRECPACRAERDRLAAGIAALRALPPAPAPSPSFAARLEARIAREGRKRSWLERILDRAAPAGLRWKVGVPASAAAIAAAAALLAVRAQRAEEAELARHLDLLLDYEVVASLGDVQSAEDAALVAVLDEIEGREGRP